MLEEALRSASAAPADTALAMASFLQEELPAGGSAAEARFFHLFQLLLDRVFGPLVPPGYIHEYGGWLSSQLRWKPPSMDGDNSLSSLSSVSPNKRTRAMAMERDPVAVLLANILIVAIAKETDHRPGVGFPFPLLALPKATQTSWLELVAMEKEKTILSHQRENAYQLLGVLLRVPPKEQAQLRAFQTKDEQAIKAKQPLQLGPGHSIASGKPLTPTDKVTVSKDSQPVAMLSMLEIYLFLFIRYPLASPKLLPQSYSFPSQFSNASSLSRKLPFEHWGEKVYEYLFRQYLLRFLPYGKLTGDSRQSWRRDSELFLRIVLELWMDSQVIVTPLDKVAEAVLEHRKSINSDSVLSLDLNESYGLTQVKYVLPPKQVQLCIMLLIKRVVADPAVKAACEPEVAARRGVSGLSSPMNFLQQSFYNFVRGSLRHAPIHVRGSSFYYALEEWLLWLEPWNVTSSVASKQPSSVAVPQSRPSERSKYTAQWEPYIFANLHFYTVPLAIFLRRSRELDFSPKDFRSSLALVQRVFRIFTPQVLHAIQRGLSPQRLAGKYGNLVQNHEQNLGPHSPSVLGEMTLASCKDDMHCLLEEIYLQHFKAVKEMDVFDRFFAYLESFAGQGVVSGERKSLAHLVDQAKLIVQLSDDYEVIPKGATAPAAIRPAAVVDNDDRTKLERTPGGILTAQSRELVLSGAVKCGLDDVFFLGDPMTRLLVQDYEIEFLVPLTIQLSHWLNQKFGIRYCSSDEALDPDDPLFLQKLAKETEEVRKLRFRFNVRFLADYRNLIFLALLTQLLVWTRNLL